MVSIISDDDEVEIIEPSSPKAADPLPSTSTAEEPSQESPEEQLVASKMPSHIIDALTDFKLFSYEIFCEFMEIVYRLNSPIG